MNSLNMNIKHYQTQAYDVTTLNMFRGERGRWGGILWDSVLPDAIPEVFCVGPDQKILVPEKNVRKIWSRDFICSSIYVTHIPHKNPNDLF